MTHKASTAVHPADQHATADTRPALTDAERALAYRRRRDIRELDQLPLDQLHLLSDAMLIRKLHLLTWRKDFHGISLVWQEIHRRGKEWAEAL